MLIAQRRKTLHIRLKTGNPVSMSEFSYQLGMVFGYLTLFSVIYMSIGGKVLHFRKMSESGWICHWWKALVCFLFCELIIFFFSFVIPLITKTRVFGEEFLFSFQFPPTLGSFPLFIHSSYSLLCPAFFSFQKEENGRSRDRIASKSFFFFPANGRLEFDSWHLQ